MRKRVRTAAGAKKYGKPIGSILGATPTKAIGKADKRRGLLVIDHYAGPLANTDAAQRAWRAAGKPKNVFRTHWEGRSLWPAAASDRQIPWVGRRKLPSKRVSTRTITKK